MRVDSERHLVALAGHGHMANAAMRKRRKTFWDSKRSVRRHGFSAAMR
jgi:hypothetical protein